MRFGQIRRQIQRPSQLVDRLAIGFALERAAAGVEMKGRELLLIALAGGADHVVDARAGGHQLLVQPLETARHGIAGAGLRLPALVLRRQPFRELALARGLGGGAGLLQRDAENEMRIAVAGIAAHRFAQPIDRGARILVEPVRVAEVEEQIAIRRDRAPTPG